MADLDDLFARAAAERKRQQRSARWDAVMLAAKLEASDA